MSAGYDALRHGCGWLDLTGRGKIAATGEDRARLLHAMTTNHVQELTPGQGCYAFFLNAQGRILGDVNLLCFEDHFLLDVEPEVCRKLFEHLDRYIIADDVVLEDRTGEIATIAVEGPEAGRVLASVGLPRPEQPFRHVSSEGTTVASIAAVAAGGYRVFAALEEKEGLIRRLESAGAVAADSQDALVVRLENGRPRYGDDITDAHLPQETQLAHALHFNKGCYIGQEIVERIRSRGHVNRLLVSLLIDGTDVPPRGAKLTKDGKECGELTSAAFSPALGQVVALGYVRAPFARPETWLEVGNVACQVRIGVK